MSLEDGAHKDILEEDYRKYRKEAEQARETGNSEKAAKYYRQCANVVDEIADLESNDKLEAERRDLAGNLRQAADTLDQHGTLESDEEVDETERSSASSSRQGGDSDEGPDPSKFLEAPPDMDFDDVGGMTELKETLKDKVIDPLDRPELYERYNLGVVNGVLLYGPPGTGKTYITKALAGKLDYNLIEAQASDVTSSLVGESADNIAELFTVAKDNQPCLVFLDEIDAIATERSGGSQKTMSESQMITQFLTEMSELKGEDVVVVSATNRPDAIDGAAWRRFDERIEVPPPDATARAAILRVHLRDRPALTEEIDWDEIKTLTEGYSSSDLEIIANEASYRALKETRESDDFQRITQSHLEQAIEEVDSSLQAWSGG